MRQSSLLYSTKENVKNLQMAVTEPGALFPKYYPLKQHFAINIV